MSKGIKLTKEQEKSRKLRSIAMGLGLSAFVIMVFLVTYFRTAQEAGLHGL